MNTQIRIGMGQGASQWGMPEHANTPAPDGPPVRVTEIGANT